HCRAAFHHRQRNHRLACRARPPHRPSRGGDGDGADVCLHRLRRGDCRNAQHARVRDRGAGEAAPMTAASIRHWLRRPWLARIGVIVLLFALWEIAARWWVDPMFLSPPSRVFMSLQRVLDTRGVPAALRITFWELGIAFVLSVLIGLVVGLAVGLAP